MSQALLMGNAAFAHAALRSGVEVVAGYPGTPSSELIETVAELRDGGAGSAKDVYVEWSTNEKAALEVAFGASLAGARALFTCKQVGLNVASDALMSLNYLGVRGGLVLFVADDPGPISSQTEQDTRRFASFAKVPVLDPATPEQGFEMMQAAFEISERYSMPVIVRPTTRINHASTFFDVEGEGDGEGAADVAAEGEAEGEGDGEGAGAGAGDVAADGEAEGGARAELSKASGHERDPLKWVIFPKLSNAAHARILETLEKIPCDLAGTEADFNNVWEAGGAGTAGGAADGTASEPEPASEPELAPATASAPNSPKLAIFTGGVSTQYAREALELLSGAAKAQGIALPSYKLMQIGMPFPFPARDVAQFLDGVSHALVFEELDSVIEEELLKVAGRNHLDVEIHGRLTGEAAIKGENSTEIVAEYIAEFFDKYTGGSEQRTSEKGVTFAKLVQSTIGKDALLQYEGKLPVRPPVLCAGCPHRGSFYAMKQAVKKLGLARDDVIFCGDIGCYTLGNAAPLDATDTCLCMGAGITIAQGLNIVDGAGVVEKTAEDAKPARKQVAFVGDSTFFASGMTGVANAVYNKHDITIAILDNSTTAMTGAQPHPGTGATLMNRAQDAAASRGLKIEEVLKSLGVEFIQIVDPLNNAEATAVSAEALEFSGPSAVIFRSPCVWLHPFGKAVRVNTDACVGCKKCITEIGCPGIAFSRETKGAKSGNRGQAVIDTSQCNGCELCVSVCPFGAIEASQTADMQTPTSQGGDDR